MTPTQQLQAGIQALGLDLSAEQQTHLLAYTDLLKKWNKTYNLTALRDEAQMVSHHLLDSLTLLPYLHTLNLAESEQKNLHYFEEPSPAREISLLYHRNELKINIINALYDVIAGVVRGAITFDNLKIIDPILKRKGKK